MTRHFTALFIAWLCGPALAQPGFDPMGPFTMGEAMPDHPATCETIGQWIDRAPDYQGRISMAIQGALVETHWDGALAYLIICDPKDVQVMCVTYEPAAPDPDRQVLLAGGFIRVGERQIMLDPCLISPLSEDDETAG